MPYTNPVKHLVDDHILTVEEIAVKTGAAASTVWDWYRHDKLPRNRIYLKKLLLLIKKVEHK